MVIIEVKSLGVLKKSLEVEVKAKSDKIMLFL